MNNETQTIVNEPKPYRTPDQFYSIPYIEKMHADVVERENPRKAFRILNDLAKSKSRKICALYPYRDFAETSAEIRMLTSQVDDLNTLIFQLGLPDEETFN